MGVGTVAHVVLFLNFVGVSIFAGAFGRETRQIDVGGSWAVSFWGHLVWYVFSRIFVVSCTRCQTCVSYILVGL